MNTLRIFSCAWAAPASAIGLLAASAAVLLGATCRPVNGVMEVEGGQLPSVPAECPPAAPPNSGQ